MDALIIVGLILGGVLCVLAVLAILFGLFCCLLVGAGLLMETAGRWFGGIGLIAYLLAWIFFFPFMAGICTVAGYVVAARE